MMGHKKRKLTKTSLKRCSQKSNELNYTSHLPYFYFSALCTNTHIQRRAHAATVPSGCTSRKQLNFSVRRRGQIISSQPIPHRLQWDSALVTPATKEMEEKVALACVCRCPAFSYQAEITEGAEGAAGQTSPTLNTKASFLCFLSPGRLVAARVLSGYPSVIWVVENSRKYEINR